ncbi:MAG: colicin E3/pyocin S6 family cytotoxin [Cyclobacteriaceae bacterium]|nr:colicin E3/pyocin S6 family cytotoxin [Cyclobacteriaceae bacterium]
MGKSPKLSINQNNFTGGQALCVFLLNSLALEGFFVAFFAQRKKVSSNFTVYVSPFVVLRSGNYTKHYYIEGQRIVSKLGGGWEGEATGQAGSGKVDYNKKEKQMQEGIVKNLKWLGLDGQALTAGKSGKTPPGQLNGTGGKPNPAEPNRYYYHPDHLGSTSYITDASGEVYQHLEYFAFGETFVEEHSNTDRTPYLYNGKELDEETGLYYYGARYYDPMTSIFVSVDPLAEMYGFQSAYVYAANNPVRFMDILGMGPGEGDGSNIYYKNGKEVMRASNGEGNPDRHFDFVENKNYKTGYEVIERKGEQSVSGGHSGGRQVLAGGSSHDTPPPKDLPGFPDAEVVKRKNQRKRWELPNGDILEWDRNHGGELERYNPRGKHIGVWSPEGEQIKDPVPGRRIEPLVTPIPQADPWYIPSPQAVENVIMYGTVAVGVGIIIFDIVTIPSGEGAVGVLLIQQAIH